MHVSYLIVINELNLAYKVLSATVSKNQLFVSTLSNKLSTLFY